jgi:two-component system response regulator
MENKMILLVEDKPDDEALVLRAREKSYVGSEVFVIRDGAEALDFLFCSGAYAERDLHDLPELILNEELPR